MKRQNTTEPDAESIRMALDQAWSDHQHTRDQTWKALQMEFFLAAGLVGIEWQIHNAYATIFIGLLVIVTALCGVQITLRHRNKVELTKFKHIENCEKALGLYRSDLIGKVGQPAPISWLDAFKPWKSNTAIFILRMHMALLVFAGVFVVWRVITHYW